MPPTLPDAIDRALWKTARSLRLLRAPDCVRWRHRVPQVDAIVDKIAKGESVKQVLAFVKTLADGVHNA